MVSAPLLFVMSGLFLMNTVMYPAASFPYQVGEVLCFILAPILLISGIVVCIIAPHEKKEKRTPIHVATSLRKKPAIYSVARLQLLLVSRIVGAVFVIIMLAAPFIGDEPEKWNLLLALFVAFPFPVFTMPYMAMALYLALHKTPRRIDILPIIGCIVILLFLTQH
jgi:hypothetical protein